MADFNDQLNSILSNPDAMAQIMQLAQSLGGGQTGGGEAGAPPSGPSQPPQPQPSWSPPPGNGGGGGPVLPPLAGGIDPKLMGKLLPLIQELGGQQDSNARQLLYALRPYLKAERQEKIEAKKRAKEQGKTDEEAALSQKEKDRRRLAEARRRNAEKYGDTYVEVTDEDLK